jgi:hypothetical protein
VTSDLLHGNSRLWQRTSWLLAIAVVCSVARGAGWTTTADARATWNDNITNANRSVDRIAALGTSVEAATSSRIGIARNDALIVGGRVASDWIPRFDDLRQHALGGHVEWQHKFGLGPLAPTLGVELAVDAILAPDRDREGTSSAGRVTLRKRFDDVWRATFTQDFGRHDARSPVFDRQSRETSIAVNRPVGEVWFLTLRMSYRDGDVVSYGTPPRPDLVPLAPNRVPTTTFGRTMVAYSIDASSIMGDVALARSIGTASSLTLSYGHRKTYRQPLVYSNNVIAVGFGHRF